MERVARCAAAPHAISPLRQALKRACSQARNVFLYCDTVTARVLQNGDCRGGLRMGNATEIRRPDESVRTNRGNAFVAESLTGGRDRCEQLLAQATSELDRLYEQVRESGYVLLLTDADGTILHEKSN